MNCAVALIEGLSAARNDPESAGHSDTSAALSLLRPGAAHSQRKLIYSQKVLDLITSLDSGVCWVSTEAF